MRSRLCHFRSSGIEQEDQRDPARQKELRKSISGLVQVRRMKPVEYEVTFIRDKRFEFASSHLSYFCIIMFVCYVVIFNKLLQLLWKNIGVCELYGTIC